ncbi:MAG: hypothetical protein PHV33_05865 [Elusimicrobiales bacterium]|nr:hypothetical protein [Elusimicrobiales bacterium]
MKTAGRPALLSGAALPLLLAAGLAALVFLPGGPGLPRAYLEKPEPASFLLAGLFHNGAGWGMPLFGALLAAAKNFGAEAALLLAVRFGGYLLTFAAGALFRGRRAGLLALAAAGVFEAAAGFSYDAEQSFYTFFLLLTLCLLLRRGRSDSPRAAALAGLGVGAGLLVRTPLFLFPPVFELSRLACCGARGRAFWPRAALFTLSAYALLLPWGLLNKSVSGRFALLDSGRAACNLVTAARGAVYTMNGDTAALAAPGGESPLKFYFSEAAAKPLDFALTVLRRLWAIFLFYPAPLLLFLAAAVFSRGGDRLPLLLLPAYFIGIHALLPVEERYFYPLLFLLPPLLGAPFFKAGGEDRTAELAVSVSSAAGLGAALAVLALVLAYPGRAARSGAAGVTFREAAAVLNGDRTLRELACAELWLKGAYSGQRACLAEFSSDFRDAELAYTLGVFSSEEPAALKLPPGCATRCAAALALREFELGRGAAGAVTLGRARALYAAEHAGLRSAPYARDRELDALLQGAEGPFWSVFVYRELLRLPPERMAKILAALEKNAAFDGSLRLLADALGEMRAGSFGPREVRRWLAPGVFGLSQAGLERLWSAGAAKAVALKGEAEKRTKAGDKAGARAELLRALEVDFNPATAGVLLELCQAEGQAAEALKYCRAASYAAYFAADGRPPLAAAEAGWRAYGLLRALGRPAQARAELLRAAQNAPADWPRRAEAEAALAARS